MGIRGGVFMGWRAVSGSMRWLRVRGRGGTFSGSTCGGR